MPTQDLANQVRFSVRYVQAMKAAKLPPGKYLSPEAAEYFSGLVHVARLIWYLISFLFPHVRQTFPLQPFCSEDCLAIGLHQISTLTRRCSSECSPAPAQRPGSIALPVF